MVRLWPRDAEASRWRVCALAFLTVVLGSSPAVDGARILAIETVAGRSHWNFMSSVLRALTDEGHHVTVFTPLPAGERENYTEIDTSGDLPKKLGIPLKDMMTVFGDPVKILRVAPTIARSYCDIVLGNDRLKGMMDGRVRTDFDVLLVEPLWVDCVSYVVAELNMPPLVLVMPQPVVSFLERSAFGCWPNPATVSNFLAGHAVPKTFVQRLANAVLLAYGALTFELNRIWFRYTDPRPYDLSPPVPPSLVLVNTHHVTEASRPTPSKFVQIGGIHLEAAQTLPHDILEFIEGSPHGVIYFTFGSVVMMSTLPDNINNAFKEALAKVPQRVLWKYEGEMKDKPANVMTSKWFPQRDILMHPNVKLFISHGGISGVYEAVDAGVPVLGFPLFYDQPRNIDNLVEAGMAISMDLLTVEKESFLKNVLELINNENYTKNAKIASEIFKDRPMSPAQSVVYWTEYVIRHKGAPHLMSHAHNLTWYQYLLLDVIATVSVLILLVLFIVFKMFKMIYLIFTKSSRNLKIKSE